MLFNWFTRRRRRAILARPFPNEWSEIISSNVWHASLLDDQQQEKLRRLVQVFTAEKNWEGCGGLSITDEIKVTIAALASLLVVGQPDDFFFDHVLSVLVYPTAYIAPTANIGRAGIVVEEGVPRLGEAWYRGPVVLSWEDSLAGGRWERPGHNLVLHEFAHQLDMINGHIVDGVPPLPTRQQTERWTEVFEAEYQLLVEECHNSYHPWLDCYAATNHAEFFAVLTESFFERPHAVRSHRPNLYELLRDFYRLDPITWDGV